MLLPHEHDRQHTDTRQLYLAIVSNGPQLLTKKWGQFGGSQIKNRDSYVLKTGYTVT